MSSTIRQSFFIHTRPMCCVVRTVADGAGTDVRDKRRYVRVDGAVVGLAVRQNIARQSGHTAGMHHTHGRLQSHRARAVPGQTDVRNSRRRPITSGLRQIKQKRKNCLIIALFLYSFRDHASTVPRSFRPSPVFRPSTLYPARSLSFSNNISRIFSQRNAHHHFGTGSARHGHWRTTGRVVHGRVADGRVSDRFVRNRRLGSRGHARLPAARRASCTEKLY